MQGPELSRAFMLRYDLYRHYFPLMALARAMTVYTRFRDWAKAGVWKRLFDAVSDEPDMEYVMVDATIVKVHRHGQGAKGGRKTKPSAARKAG